MNWLQETPLINTILSPWCNKQLQNKRSLDLLGEFTGSKAWELSQLGKVLLSWVLLQAQSESERIVNQQVYYICECSITYSIKSSQEITPSERMECAVHADLSFLSINNQRPTIIELWPQNMCQNRNFGTKSVQQSILYAHIKSSVIHTLRPIYPGEGRVYGMKFTAHNINDMRDSKKTMKVVIISEGPLISLVCTKRIPRIMLLKSVKVTVSIQQI